jgi:hypothetical protein
LEWGRASRQLPAKRSGLGTTDSAVATGGGGSAVAWGKPLPVGSTHCQNYRSSSSRRLALAGQRSCRSPHIGDPSVVRQGEDLRVASNGEVLEFEGMGRGGVLDDRGEDRPPCARAASLNLDWIEFLGSGSLTESFVASCLWGSWGGGRVRVSGGMRGRNQRTLALYIYFNLLGPHVSDINMSVTCDLNHRFGTDGWIKLGWNGPSHFFTV